MLNHNDGTRSGFQDSRITIPYLTVPYHTIPYHTIPYHTIPYHTIPYHTIPYHTIQYYTILYYTALYYRHSQKWILGNALGPSTRHGTTGLAQILLRSNLHGYVMQLRCAAMMRRDCETESHLWVFPRFPRCQGCQVPGVQNFQGPRTGGHPSSKW